MEGQGFAFLPSSQLLLLLGWEVSHIDMHCASGGSPLSTVDTGAGSFSVRGCLGHCRVLSSITSAPTPHPFDARNTARHDSSDSVTDSPLVKAL